jgi:hypothetical protein
MRLILLFLSGILLLMSCSEKQSNVELDCKGKLPNGKDLYKIFVNPDKKIIIVNNLFDYNIKAQTLDKDSRVLVGEIIFDKDDKDQTRIEHIIIIRVSGAGYFSVTKNRVNKKYNFNCEKVENKF